MSLIFHLSSLNIDQTIPPMLNDLAKDMANQKPDLVIVSGNFVKRPSVQNFKLAQEFLDMLDAPVFCVSGNHDLSRSLFGKGNIFFDPFLLYRDMISPTQDGVFENDHVYCVGINTSRPVLPHFNWSNGMISQNQISFVQNQFRSAPSEKLRIFVCHHPFVSLGKGQEKSLIWGSTQLLSVLEDQHVDVILTDCLKDVMILPSVGNDVGPIMLGAFTGQRQNKTHTYNIIHVSLPSLSLDMMSFDGKNHMVMETHTRPRPVMDEEPLDFGQA